MPKEMKDASAIERALGNLPSINEPSRYSGMTYEEGIRIALEWVLGDVDDDEFEYADE